MAVKAGQILHVGNGQTVIDRIQTGGPGQLNIPIEKINELGNYKSVATIRNTPDLSFTLNSLDVSTEIETMLTQSYTGRNVTDAVMTAASPNLTSATAAFTTADVGRMVIVAGAGQAGGELVATILTYTSATAVVLDKNATASVSAASLRITQNGIDLANCKPLDFAGQFKAGQNAADPFKVVRSVAVPFLYLSQVQYQFGLTANASQNVTLNGDTIFYAPGVSFVETTAGTGSAGQAVVSAHPAYQAAVGDSRRILAVTAAGQRLVFGVDYTETYGTVTSGAAITTVTLAAAVATTDTIRIIYSSPDTVDYSQSVHEGVTVKPAAVKGRDIEVYIGGYDPNDRAGSLVNKASAVQQAAATWAVTLDKDEEFGNHYRTGQDFDVPTVSGTVDFKPRDPQHMVAFIQKITGVTDPTKVVGPDTAVPLPLDIVIKNPDTGVPVKRFHLDDARFTVPGYSGQVAQKVTQSVKWDSDEGSLMVFER